MTITIDVNMTWCILLGLVSIILGVITFSCINKVRKEFYEYAPDKYIMLGILSGVLAVVFTICTIYQVYFTRVDHSARDNLPEIWYKLCQESSKGNSYSINSCLFNSFLKEHEEEMPSLTLEQINTLDIYLQTYSKLSLDKNDVNKYIFREPKAK